MSEACGFCGDTTGPFTRIEGLFDVLMCPRCQHDRGHAPGPYPAMTPEQHRASLELLPSWVLAEKVTAFSVPACERIVLGIDGLWWTRYHNCLDA